MTSNSNDLFRSITCLRSSSPTDQQINAKKSLFTACCSCSRSSPPKSVNEEKGFFKRIQRFKAQKRQSIARKQQLAAAAAAAAASPSTTGVSSSPVSNHHENDRLLTVDDDDDDERESGNVYPVRSDSLSTTYSPRRIRNSRSIPLLHRHEDVRTSLDRTIDLAQSFTDIEVASSNRDETIDLDQRIPSTTSHQPSFSTHIDRQQDQDTPKSFPSRDFSSMATNLSAFSTQSLLRKLLDKAQVLNEYYNDICHRTNPSENDRIHRSTRKRSSSISSSSLLGRSGATPRSFLHRDQSNESIKRNRRKRPSIYDNMSTDSSRFNLYADEDNVLKELIRFNNDIDLILSRLEMEGENVAGDVPNSPIKVDREEHVQATTSNVYPSDDSGLAASPALVDRDEPDPITLQSNEVITMRTNNNEINIHLLLSNDINRLRETALSKLLKLTEQNCTGENLHHHQSITLTKLNKLPKSSSWKGKRVFGVPLRVYQQTTGQILPVAITNALQYVRINAGKCEGLFRKPGVKSKIDRLRAQIETSQHATGETSSFEAIKFDDYQPFVVADVIRQYFRELPECLMPPALTRLLCDLIKSLNQEDQLLAIRFVFLLLPDETRDVLETILRFLLDVSIRSGNSQTTCRSLARIFVPSIFQSYHDMHNQSSKILWWKWKKEKLDAIQQESERLTLELCLMTMILNVDLLCRVPSSLSEELKLPTARKIKRLDDLVRQTCNGEFHMKKYIGKDMEQFFQRLSSMKFKNVQTNFDGVDVTVHKPTTNDESSLPIWKCSIDIPNNNIKQICQRITHERYLWDSHFAESRTVEKIDDEKEIVQYVLNFLDLVPVRSFCEFRYTKKIASRSIPDANAMLISAVSIDHLQNHFLPGSIGQTHEMHYYVAPSTCQPGYTTVTQVACVDFSGRSTQWYENVFGCLLAHNLLSLRETFTNTKIVKV